MPGFLNAVHPPEWVALNNINETGNRALGRKFARRSTVTGQTLGRCRDSHRHRQDVDGHATRWRASVARQGPAPLYDALSGWAGTEK